MNEIKTKKQKIENLVWELWNLLPEPKKSYTHYYQGIDRALENWSLSDREKRIGTKEEISNDKV